MLVMDYTWSDQGATSMESNLWNTALGPDPYEQGRAKARDDLREGRVAIMLGGMIGSLRLDEILAAEYDIEVHQGGCMISMAQLEFARGYNEISESWIDENFGAGLLKIISDRVERESREKFEKEWPKIKAQLDRPLETTINDRGWVKCPHCGRRFSWRHRRLKEDDRHDCGGRIVIKREGD